MQYMKANVATMPLNAALESLSGNALDPLLANAIVIALKPITGSMMRIEYGDSYSRIVPSEAEASRLSEWILAQINKDPGGIRFDVSGVWPKVVLRQWWPYMLGIFAGGFLMGKVLK